MHLLVFALLERVAVLECVATNSWQVIRELCEIISTAEAERFERDAELALLRAAITWHSGVEPDRLLYDYRQSLIERE